ncbi:MAG: hypothetical protein KTR14_01235 [Vampirovibrio sp.]|nr:hypothetical protein [Vampirovibrio sp.]
MGRNPEETISELLRQSEVTLVPNKKRFLLGILFMVFIAGPLITISIFSTELPDFSLSNATWWEWIFYIGFWMMNILGINALFSKAGQLTLTPTHLYIYDPFKRSKSFEWQSIRQFYVRMIRYSTVISFENYEDGKIERRILTTFTYKNLNHEQAANFLNQWKQKVSP